MSVTEWLDGPRAIYIHKDNDWTKHRQDKQIKKGHVV
jgi:hypothetical protein